MKTKTGLLVSVAVVAALPAWELYGRRGLVGEVFPGAENPLQGGDVSYHMRTGEHDLTPYDWDRYMDFADRHGWKTNGKGSVVTVPEKQI